MTKKTDTGFRPGTNHYNIRLGIYRETVTKSQLQDALLNWSMPFAQGYLCVWKSNHLGAEIYDMWLEKDYTTYPSEKP
jgi:hypothetical protein